MLPYTFLGILLNPFSFVFVESAFLFNRFAFYRCLLPSSKSLSLPSTRLLNQILMFRLAMTSYTNTATQYLLSVSLFTWHIRLAFLLTQCHYLVCRLLWRLYVALSVSRCPFKVFLFLPFLCWMFSSLTTLFIISASSVTCLVFLISRSLYLTLHQCFGFNFFHIFLGLTFLFTLSPSSMYLYSFPPLQCLWLVSHSLSHLT